MKIKNEEASFFWFIFFWWYIDILKQKLEESHWTVKNYKLVIWAMDFFEEDITSHRVKDLMIRKTISSEDARNMVREKLKFRKKSCIFQLDFNFLSSKISSDEKSLPHFLICFSTINSKRYDQEAVSYGHSEKQRFVNNFSGLGFSIWMKAHRHKSGCTSSLKCYCGILMEPLTFSIICMQR